MTSTQIVILIVVVLAVLLVAAVAVRLVRRRSLQQTFGPEYDRVVAEQDSRTAGEKELRDRERRHAELHLTDLSAESRARYRAAWEEVQVRFVDAPVEAVGTADELVTRLIAERGYPTGDYNEQLSHLSVEHAETLGHYRDAHEISERNDRGEASTEDLRLALVHYRALFGDLLGEEPVVPAQDGRRRDDRQYDEEHGHAHDDAHPNGTRPDTATR